MIKKILKTTGIISSLAIITSIGVISVACTNQTKESNQEITKNQKYDHINPSHTNKIDLETSLSSTTINDVDLTINYKSKLDNLSSLLFPEFIANYDTYKDEWLESIGLKNKDFINKQQFMDAFKFGIENNFNAPIIKTKNVYDQNKELYKKTLNKIRSIATSEDEQIKKQKIKEYITTNNDNTSLYINPKDSLDSNYNVIDTINTDTGIVFKHDNDYQTGTFRVYDNESNKDSNENFVIVNYAFADWPTYYNKMTLQERGWEKYVESIYIHPQFFEKSGMLVMNNLNKKSYDNQVMFSRLYRKGERLSVSIKLKKEDYLKENIVLPKISFIPKQIIPINQFDTFTKISEFDSPYATKFEVRIGNKPPFDLTVINTDHVWHTSPKLIYEKLKHKKDVSKMYHMHTQYNDSLNNQIPLSNPESNTYSLINHLFKSSLNKVFENTNGGKGLLFAPLFLNHMRPMVYRMMNYMFVNESNQLQQNIINRFDNHILNEIKEIITYANDLIDQNQTNTMGIVRQYNAILTLLSTTLFYLNNDDFNDHDALLKFLSVNFKEIKNNTYNQNDNLIILE